MSVTIPLYEVRVPQGGGLRFQVPETEEDGVRIILLLEDRPT